MSLRKLIDRSKQALENQENFLSEEEFSGELGELAVIFNKILQDNTFLREEQQKGVHYLRSKINQLLQVIGTVPLRDEELDDDTLINLDPIGIIAESFTQILSHLRQTNEKLELAMDEIQAIFDAVGGGLLVLDLDKRILSCNNSLLKMFDAQYHDVTGKTCRDVICHEKIEACVFDKMMATGRSASSNERMRNGRYCNIVASPVKNKQGQIVHVVLLYIDITELLEAKAAVVEEKERLSLTLESVAEGVIATDADSRITLMNRVAEELTGWPLEEALGRHVCTVFKIYEDNAKISCADIFPSRMKDGEALKIERFGNLIMETRDGSELLINVSAAPIFCPEQQSTSGSILVFRDITHEKKLEEEIIKTSRIESLGILAGGIAHDFNNLLTSILGHVSLAKTHVQANETVFHLLSETEKSSLRAKGLTQQLLTFARGGEPVSEIASINKLILDSAGFSSHGSKIKCEYSLSEDLWAVKIDKGQIGQVIQNLVINADQAMPHGGKVHISTENSIVDKLTDLPLVDGEYVKITVQDFGHGIDGKILNKIFDPYFTTKETGNGLGLTICFSIIKKHKGHIAVASELEGGTAFTVYLPAFQKKTADEDVSDEKLFGGKGKILVMDDEEFIRDVSVQLLRHLGYCVDVCSDGGEAITLYAEEKKKGVPYDAVIMDLTIPGGMGGKEAIAGLLEIDPEIKAIVSSGYANDPIMASPSTYGFIGVVPKPYSLVELGIVLHKALGTKYE